MRFKTDTDSVLHIAESIAKNTVENELNSGYGHSMNEIIARSVSRGIREALRHIIENQYTDADFEKDMGLDQ